MKRTMGFGALKVTSLNRLVHGKPCRILAAALAITIAAGCAVGASEIIKVEEDWELVVGEPDADNNAPQITCVMSPAGDTDSLHMALELNHKTLPEYDPGGHQLQVWNGESLVGINNSPVSEVLHQPGETVRWTTKMSLDGCVLTFEVTDGSSTSWGAFGGQGYLKASVNNCVSNLSNYSPVVSCTKSGIGYASNRVETLVLKEVRYYTAEGLVGTDSTDRVVFQHE